VSSRIPARLQASQGPTGPIAAAEPRWRLPHRRSHGLAAPQHLSWPGPQQAGGEAGPGRRRRRRAGWWWSGRAFSSPLFPAAVPSPHHRYQGCGCHLQWTQPHWTRSLASPRRVQLPGTEPGCDSTQAPTAAPAPPAPLLPHRWERRRSMPGSVSAPTGCERSDTGMVFRAGSVISSAAASETALGKGRRGRSSLGSKCSAKDSAVTTGELAPP